MPPPQCHRSEEFCNVLQCSGSNAVPAHPLRHGRGASSEAIPSGFLRKEEDVHGRLRRSSNTSTTRLQYRMSRREDPGKNRARRTQLAILYMGKLNAADKVLLQLLGIMGWEVVQVANMVAG